MQKKALSTEMTIGIIVGIIIIGTIIFSSFGESEIDSTEKDTITSKIFSGLSDEKKFIELGADIACARFEYAEAVREIKDNPDSEAKRTVLTEEYHNTTDLIIKKYGYKEDEVESMGQKYEEDINYAKAVIERVKTLCPGAVPELEENMAIMESGMYVRITINKETNSTKIKYKYYADGYINKGSRESTENMEDIRNTLAERMGDELADKAMEVAIFEYE